MGLLASFERACDEMSDGKKRSRDDCDNIDQPKLLQPKLTALSSTLTQHVLDEAVMDYVVDSVLPFHHVDTPAFNRFVKTLTSGRVTSCCRQTLVKQIEERFRTR